MDYFNLPNDKAFLVSVKAFIQREDKILVLQLPESNLDHWNYKWCLPGGLLEFSESILDALHREVKEETGLDIEVERVLKVTEFLFQGFIFKDKSVRDAKVVQIGFLCSPITKNIQLSDEHLGYQWFDKSELGSLSYSPDSKELIMFYKDS